ncbi:MAG: PilZ domain-containing protein [Pseudomonadota bacterium]|nr:PilZ domain-containing protein [Pseudomonadota bacterium]
MMTLYRVGSLAIDQRSELCLIKNICPNGMMVRTYCSISEGSRVTIELKCGQPISGMVSWVRDAHAGISFDEPIDVIDILSTSMNGPRPRMPRIQVGGFLTLREGAFTYRVQLCDISQGGLKIRCEKALAADSHVVVSINRIAPQPSVVRWIDGHYVGITFNRMLPLPVLVEWLRDQRDSLQTVRAAALQSSAQA